MCVCECVCVHESANGVGLSGCESAVTGRCKLPSVDTGKYTSTLFKNSLWVLFVFCLFVCALCFLFVCLCVCFWLFKTELLTLS